MYNENMDKVYEHVQEFQVKYCEADFNDALKISTALSYMEEAACSSADELGFGYAFVKPRGLAFMVTNLCCEFIKPISLGDIIKVKTWPTPPTYVVFGREYQFLSQSGEILMNASSRWCLVDVKSGKLQQSKVIDNQDYSTYNTSKALSQPEWKIPTFPKAEGEPRFTLTVAKSEYDHNMHVNNTRYADYCMNCFSVAELMKRKVKFFSISYVQQCKEGETLTFYRKQERENCYLLMGMNERNDTVVRAKIEFA